MSSTITGYRNRNNWSLGFKRGDDNSKLSKEVALHGLLKCRCSLSVSGLKCERQVDPSLIDHPQNRMLGTTGSHGVQFDLQSLLQDLLLALVGVTGDIFVDSSAQDPRCRLCACLVLLDAPP